MYKHNACILNLALCTGSEVLIVYTESPGPPQNLTVSGVTNTSVVLSWSPPDNGGGRPLSEIFYKVTANGKWLLLITHPLHANSHS